jgi:hypothetical protein
MKINEFLKSIGITIKMELPDDITKLDTELPAEFDTKFTANYLTRERAKNDDEIISEVTKKSNKNALTAVDEQIKELLPFISAEDQQKINSTFSTTDKLKLLKPAFDEAVKKVKGKAATEDIAKIESEWSAKLKASQDQHKAEINKFIADTEQKDFEGTVINKFSAYNLTKEFTPLRPDLSKMAILSLQQKGYKFQKENGQIVVREEKDGILRDVYKGETKVTFDSLLDEFATPFIAKSNATPPPNPDGKTVPVDFTGTEDLHSLMQKQAAMQTK